MTEVLALLFMWLLPIGLTYGVIRIDRRGLRADQLARMWNAASTGTALLFFSPFCVVVHFWRTRRGLRGIAQGLLWLSIIVMVLGLLTIFLDQVLPES